MNNLARLLCLFWLPLTTFASDNVVNVYAWVGETPEAVLRLFEKETGIKVNFTGIHNNETMFSKLRATNNSAYDVVMPTGCFVDRMSRLHMLTVLDKSKLPNLKHLNPDFRHPAYDKNLLYGIPHVWGVTGIFYNSKYYPENSIRKWSDLLDSRYRNQLMLLDDTRDVFAMSLLASNQPANDADPEHIKTAFLQLKEYMKNIKVFSIETIASNIIDEDANIGMAWNGDVYKATIENPDVKFIYPEDGFVIWVDNLAIPANAKHKEAAYKFINFMLRPEIAKMISLTTHFPTANLSGQQLLPAEIRNNPIAYPPKEVLHRGQFQTDLGSDAMATYERYWEELKMSG